MCTVVLDTNVVVSAMRSGGGASRQVLRCVLSGQAIPLFGNALWQEYEELLGRDIWSSETTHEERWQLLAALARVGRWVHVYFGWRPNLRDEGDNHLIELALAGNAQAIVTHNVRDLTRGELSWPTLSILTPAQFLKEQS